MQNVLGARSWTREACYCGGILKQDNVSASPLLQTVCIFVGALDKRDSRFTPTLTGTLTRARGGEFWD